MSWRVFKFFDFEELKDPDTNQPFDKLKVSGDAFGVAGVCQVLVSVIGFCSK